MATKAKMIAKTNQFYRQYVALRESQGLSIPTKQSFLDAIELRFAPPPPSPP